MRAVRRRAARTTRTAPGRPGTSTGGFCTGRASGCENHPENQYQVLTYRGGTFQACARTASAARSRRQVGPGRHGLTARAPCVSLPVPRHSLTAPPSRLARGRPGSRRRAAGTSKAADAAPALPDAAALIPAAPAPQPTPTPTPGPRRTRSRSPATPGGGGGDGRSGSCGEPGAAGGLADQRQAPRAAVRPRPARLDAARRTRRGVLPADRLHRRPLVLPGAARGPPRAAGLRGRARRSRLRHRTCRSHLVGERQALHGPDGGCLLRQPPGQPVPGVRLRRRHVPGLRRERASAARSRCR